MLNKSKRRKKSLRIKIPIYKENPVKSHQYKRGSTLLLTKNVKEKV